MKTHIYVLRCPISGDVRYVGKTNDMRRRLWNHVDHSKKNYCKTKTSNWIKDILDLGELPVMECVETVEVEDWKEAEAKWIVYYKASGAPLTNATRGGDQPPPITDEMRGRLSELSKARWADMGKAARIVESGRITRNLPESRLKASISAKKKWQNADFADFMHSVSHTPELTALRAQKTKQLMSDPGARLRIAKAVSKLGDESVREIRSLKMTGMTYAALAEKYSIAVNTVLRIVKRRAYEWVA